MLKDFIKSSKAISDETRVRILKLLEKQELCVCQLMAILEIGQSTVSKHLGILKNVETLWCIWGSGLAMQYKLCYIELWQGQ